MACISVYLVDLFSAAFSIYIYIGKIFRDYRIAPGRAFFSSSFQNRCYHNFHNVIDAYHHRTHDLIKHKIIVCIVKMFAGIMALLFTEYDVARNSHVLH